MVRDQSRQDTPAERQLAEHQVAVDVLPADLANPAELSALETRLRHDTRIDILINNADMAQSVAFWSNPPRPSNG